MKFIPNSVVRLACRQILTFKRNSPHIFFGLGIAGTVTSTVLACRATLKLSEALDEAQNDINSVKQLKKSYEQNKGSSYPIEKYNNDLIYVHLKAGLNIGKLYGPSIIIGAASIAALTGSHVQLARRNSALMAAYAAVSKAYKDYRDRVREELGEEKELDIYHAARKEVIAELDNKEVKVVNPNQWSPYAKFFDEACPRWQKDPELNRMFIQSNQNYANNLLIARGYLFLNEVYDMLGIDRTKAGQVVGWVIGEDGDNYIDFGMFDAYNSRFVNGWERSILLDFNVDGVIYDKVWRKDEH